MRDDLLSNLRRYYLDRVDTAIATPHAAERSKVFLGTKAGSVGGEVIRFMMQFKTFPVTYVMRPLYAVSLGRVPTAMRSGVFTKDMMSAIQTPGTLIAMTQLLAATTVLGYVSLCGNNLLDQKELPSLDDPKTWLAALNKGGGLGIFGDFIFSEYDRYGNTLTQAMAGPVFGEMNSIASIISKIKEGKTEKASAEAIKTLKRNVPMRNLFYLQPVLKYYNIEM